MCRRVSDFTNGPLGCCWQHHYISRNDEMATTTLPDIVQVYKALGHPTRIRILAMLRAGELCACQITTVLGLAPSTVSAHLAELRRADLTEERKDGRWVFYSLARSDRVRETADELWQRVRRDPQIRADSNLVKRLRGIPVEQLCRADLDISQFTIGGTSKTL